MEQGISHAVIVAGPPEEAGAAAMELAKTLLCAAPEGGRRPCGACPHCRKIAAGVHPDVIAVERQKDGKGQPRREIYVEQIRDVVGSAPILPNEAARKVYLIRDAGAMNAAAQNALLKLLEEPPSFVSLILTAESEASLLETVRSRCVLRRAGPGGEEPPPAEALARAEAYLAAARGSRTALIRFANENAELSSAEMQEFTACTRALLADMLCARAPAGGLTKREMARLAGLMDRAEEYLRANVNAKHVLGMLSAKTIQNGKEPAPPP